MSLDVKIMTDEELRQYIEKMNVLLETTQGKIMLALFEMKQREFQKGDKDENCDSTKTGP